LSWYFVLFFRYAWAHLTNKWGTLDTLPLGQSKQLKLEGLYWHAIQNNSNL